MAVSCACSLEIRRNELSNLFVNLLCDQSRWVRMSAFQQLGPFISTFADADRTDLVISEDGLYSFLSKDSCKESQEDTTKIDRDVNDLENDGDLSGILQLKSLDSPDMPTESSTDPCNTSNNSQQLQNEMCIDSDDVTNEEERGRLAFSDENKSAEELRAAAWLATSNIGEIVNHEDLGKTNSSFGLEELNLSDDAQSCACDSSSSNGAIDSSKTSTSFSSSSQENASQVVKDQSPAESDQLSQSLKRSNIQDSAVPSVDKTFATAGSGDGKSISSDNSVPSLNSQEEMPSGNGAGDKSALDEVTTPVHIHLDNNFNTFQYWRSPLPEVNIDFDIINGQPTNIHVVAKVKDDDSNKVYASEMNVSISDSSPRVPSIDSLVSASSSLPSTSASDTRSSSLTSSVLSSYSMADIEKGGVRIHTASVSTVSDAAEETVAHIGSTHVLGQHLGEQHLTIVDGIVQDMSGSSLSFMDDTSSLEFGMDDAALAQQQSIVPQLLLENYLGMVDPSRAQTVDGEITKHCAYNLPAVAYTLGRQNWHCIKNLYETLAQDMQWKVRRTLAFSIHELALIVGEEITHKDLVPVFDGFLKDLDEVRIGVLKHLADIFKLLRPEVRLQYLARTQEFMKTDNNKNWRFREELAEQLIQICYLFHCIDVVTHIIPLAMAMLMDKVAQVRLVALRLVSAVLKKTCEDGEKKLLASVCNDIIGKFATDYRWLLRQTFAQLCYVILEEDALPPSVFAKNFLPSVLALSSDPVPNVRLSLSKVMAQRIMPLDYFTTQQNPYHGDLVETQQRLQSDHDKDVRYFSCQQPETDISLDHDM
ncbi:serine/threonine-protein phosphatase 4 regulatory subunit 1, partial [Elysia marginata]